MKKSLPEIAKECGIKEIETPRGMAIDDKTLEFGRRVRAQAVQHSAQCLIDLEHAMRTLDKHTTLINVISSELAEIRQHVSMDDVD